MNRLPFLLLLLVPLVNAAPKDKDKDKDGAATATNLPASRSSRRPFPRFAALETHRINSKQLVKLYLDRIAAYEGTLNAMITVNPDAIAMAHQRDVERAHGGHPRTPARDSRSSSRTTSTRST